MIVAIITNATAVGVRSMMKFTVSRSMAVKPVTSFSPPGGGSTARRSRTSWRASSL